MTRLRGFIGLCGAGLICYLAVESCFAFILLLVFTGPLLKIRIRQFLTGK